MSEPYDKYGPVGGAKQPGALRLQGSRAYQASSPSLRPGEAVIRSGANAPKVICAIGLVPSMAVLVLITLDIIGLAGSDRTPLLPASAVTPVSLLAFAWAVVWAVVALVATVHDRSRGTDRSDAHNPR